MTRKTLLELTGTLSAEIDTYGDGSQLVEQIGLGRRFDLILLDWNMPVLDGEATGQFIRRSDPDCLIVFITAFSEYVFKATKLTTFRYILKDHLEQDLAEALQAAVRSRRSSERVLLIRTQDNTKVQLKIKDILYAEHLAKRNVIHTNQAVYYEYYGSSLKDIEDILRENGFVLPYRGILVNVGEILEMRKTDLRLSNGETVPLSRNHQLDVMDAIRRHLEG